MLYAEHLLLQSSSLYLKDAALRSTGYLFQRSALTSDPLLGLTGAYTRSFYEFF